MHAKWRACATLERMVVRSNDKNAELYQLLQTSNGAMHVAAAVCSFEVNLYTDSNTSSSILQTCFSTSSSNSLGNDFIDTPSGEVVSVRGLIHLHKFDIGYYKPSVFRKLIALDSDHTLRLHAA